VQAEVGQQMDEWLTPDFGYSLRGLTIIERQRSAYQLVEILQSPTFGKVLRLDGAMQCSERDEHFYHEPLVHMPMAHAASRQRVLIVGGGDGGAAEEVLKWPDVCEVTHVEIDPVVIDLSRRHLGAVHRGVLEGCDPRYRLFWSDGALFMQRATPSHYDVVLLDLTDAGGPSESLYRSDFYEACARTLKPGGVLSLHVAAPWTQLDTCRATLTQLRRAFKVVLPFLVSVPMSGGQWLMAMAGNDPDVVSSERALATLPEPSDPATALKVVSAGLLKSMLVLPPYLAPLACPAATAAHSPDAVRQAA